MASESTSRTSKDDLMASDYRHGLWNFYEMCEISATTSLDNANVYITVKPSTDIGLEVLNSPNDAELDVSPYLFLDDKGELEWNSDGQQTISTFTAAKTFYSDRGWNIEVTFTFEEQAYTRTMLLDDHIDIIQDYDSISKQFKLRLGLKRKASKRSIILCFDGTSNHFSNQNTNVIKLVELLKKDNPSEQMVYYQPGVGTYSHPGFYTNAGTTLAQWADEAYAWFLYQHVIDGYKYVMETYRDGDQISIFGFSRGAYTARALAGMLHTVGLLPRHNIEQVPFAYQVYAGKISQEASAKSHPNNEHPSGFNNLIWSPIIDVCSSLVRLVMAKSETKQKDIASHGVPVKYIVGAMDVSPRKGNGRDAGRDVRPDHVDPKNFKMVFCTPVKIAFLGVWDTVGSVGTFKRVSLPWIEYNPSVQCFRQALALDETRGNFIPSLWDHTKTTTWQSAVEVWFKGGHTDVGGGAPLLDKARESAFPIWLKSLYLLAARNVSSVFNKLKPRQDSVDHIESQSLLALPTSPIPTSSELSFSDPMKSRMEDPNWIKPDRMPDMSNISLRWMINECLDRPNVRVLFDPYALHCYRRARILEKRPQGADDEDIKADRARLDDFDAQKEPYKALMTTPWWWLLEILTFPKLSQLCSNRSKPGTVYCPNLGAGRHINNRRTEDRIRLHYSVYKQMCDEKCEYLPTAKWQCIPGWSKVEDSQMNEFDPGDVLKKLNPSDQSCPEIKSAYQWVKNFLRRVAMHVLLLLPLVLLGTAVKYSFVLVLGLLREHSPRGILSQGVSGSMKFIIRFFAAKIGYTELTLQ